MNKSGESIGAITRFFKIPTDRCLLIHDEVELEFGQIGLKKGGGLAGHNGLRSAEKMLGSKEFYRLRIGVGRPLHGSVSSHVLGRFTKHELLHLDTVLTQTALLFEKACTTDSIDVIASRHARDLVI